MRFHLSTKAQGEYEALTVPLRAVFQKQITFLVRDIRHPSLHAKRYDEKAELWQARMNRSWRFYFLIHKDIYYVVSIRKHPK